jgi:hypothetical protein
MVLPLNFEKTQKLTNISIIPVIRDQWGSLFAIGPLMECYFMSEIELAGTYCSEKFLFLKQSL